MMHRVASNSSPQKFRKMSWLDNRTACSATQPLSPSKALAQYKSRPKGVKPFRLEKHSRFSCVGSHILTVQSFDYCGLDHEEQKKARDLPSMKAVSTRADVGLGAVPRFQGPDTHFVQTSAAAVESCGMSHDEEKRARELPDRKAATVKSDTGLGGMEHRFDGPNTHFVKAQGADVLLGQPAMENLAASLTIPKNNWLKNLWAVAGTAMEDREMRQCDAVMAPTLPVHRDLHATGSAVAKMSVESGPRFTYRKPTAAAGLAPHAAHNMVWQAKGAALMKTEKHSRFSTFGSHYQKKA